MHKDMRKPIIGITPFWSAEEERIALLSGYLDGIAQAGGLPIILPLTMDKDILEQSCQLVDGILFSGGEDIHPGLYGETVIPACGETCNLRDNMEKFIFSRAVMEMDKPILGVCRGFEMINVLLGGNLYQDLPSQYIKREEHGISHSQPYRLMAHEITIKKDSLLHKLLNKDTITVNSCHHQGVRELSKHLVCMATSDDELIEAFYMPGKRFVWAVQWHPESILYDENNRKLFEHFVTNCT